MDDKYKKANINGKGNQLTLGYFQIFVPEEFSEDLINGEFAPVAKVLIALSDKYNKNVIEPLSGSSTPPPPTDTSAAPATPQEDPDGQ